MSPTDPVVRVIADGDIPVSSGEQVLTQHMHWLTVSSRLGKAPGW